MICKYKGPFPILTDYGKEVMAKLPCPIDNSKTLVLDHTCSACESSARISYNMAILLQNSCDSNCTGVSLQVEWC